MKSTTIYLFASEDENLWLKCDTCYHTTYFTALNKLQKDNPFLVKCWFCHTTQWLIQVLFTDYNPDK